MCEGVRRKKAAIASHTTTINIVASLHSTYHWILVRLMAGARLVQLRSKPTKNTEIETATSQQEGRHPHLLLE